MIYFKTLGLSEDLILCIITALFDTSVNRGPVFKIRFHANFSYNYVTQNNYTARQRCVAFEPRPILANVVSYKTREGLISKKKARYMCVLYLILG